MKKDIKDLPQVLINLIKSQNEKDSGTFASCFDKGATVHDEGQTYTGSSEIKSWNKETTGKYDTYIKAQQYEDNAAGHIVKFQVSGNFEGSPIDLKYHFEISGDLIRKLTITSA